ncbi:Zn-dependent hydrolase, glyoxylase [Thermanaerovibrio velox DSM 12556]|uniref:Zn-dependent hydrolase, glyoxylase n=1 Tax=Thermanaerovibrio velox DSM 12556 TaxID=926567 RepID=H0UQF9_9BACT|nr:MBL fold metallo-hydrolase [Thermanaerovibrio velox]EHM09713.1 Zn-dependent hydrolase, glyoxylase [Thermanaerovibrio velox DSM 12556]
MSFTVRRFPLGELWTNFYLVFDEGGSAIGIDPGGDCPEVLDFIEQMGLRLQLVMLTHGHWDHMGGLACLRKASNGGVAVHRLDGRALTDPDVNLSAFLGSKGCFDPADRLVEDGDELSVGSMRVRVFHTPGHTPGSCCFLVESGDSRALFSGDTLFAGSVGRTDLPGGDEAALRGSLARLADLEDSLKVFPGHGPETTLGEERRRNPFWPR